MNKKHPYENRLKWRLRLPWFLINLGVATKGKDCELVNAQHKWFNVDGINSGCYYCKKTTNKIKYIKILADYHCSPIWILNSEGFFEDIDLEEIDFLISKSILDKLIKWQRTYDDTYNNNCPQDSGFKSKVEEHLFDKKGFEIWKDMLDELVGFNISYVSHIS